VALQIVAKNLSAVIASEAKQSTYPRGDRWIASSLSLLAKTPRELRTVRHIGTPGALRCLNASRTHTRINFFIISVHWIFTTFIACLFTNTSDAIRENRTISCV